MGHGSSASKHEPNAIRHVHSVGPRTQPRVRSAAAGMAHVDGRTGVRHGPENRDR